MTMIELGIVMGIVSVLLALVLGLARHVNTVVKIRRAQADLGEWHETLNRWHLRFGEYPHAFIDTQGNDPVENLIREDQPQANLTNLLDRCEIRFADNGPSEATFRSFLTSDLSHLDPWGTPYIYIPSENAQDYTLFSCGPDAKSSNIPSGTPLTPDSTRDDIHFER
ncbi:MAG: type II secretion system protein GspG [Kiritimatiellae bacterium]|nr:type II secretion system protein GspG [Kiritimatiellia bacterium]